MAFYISANGQIRQQLLEEKKQKFRELYEGQKVVAIKQPVKNMWRYMAAASIIIAVCLLTWFLSGGKTSSQQLADKYVQQNWQTLGVTMGSKNNLQTGLDLYNSGKIDNALTIFESLYQRDSTDNSAKKYAGIASLRLQRYEKALKYFTLLESDTQSYSNPAKFYKAITLLKRNKGDDKNAALVLLKEVVAQDLEGKENAVEWLKQND